jgi:hypothetical protein
VRHPKTGVVTRELYCANGRWHRAPDEGPALIERDARTGAVTLALNYVDGEYCPPAVVSRPHASIADQTPSGSPGRSLGRAPASRPHRCHSGFTIGRNNAPGAQL